MLTRGYGNEVPGELLAGGMVGGQSCYSASLCKRALPWGMRLTANLRKGVKIPFLEGMLHHTGAGTWYPVS